ncbi:thioesterase II family protein [Streptomyces sp. NEAU-W12]|uniref:thioesterase II family protein n=1 Tax=Streptomyces sp. NEAU-W12 TaxID=2994668 RepID=UPI00224A5F14|nr:thioesterase domain-containing protein [Streptomyces sp. NEAU-W12]MCX2923025.1 thioesterase domain-containing protein [Streptomyces sp. NEAU-W12]
MQRYLAVRPVSGTGIRLFCFHHAGAGALAFAGWQRRVGPGVSVLPVRLPGRETRRREDRITDAARLVEELQDDLGPLLDEPHAFYGHSMGALVAYRFAQHRAHTGQRPPRLLAVGACSAPHLPAPLLQTLLRPELPDEELILSLGGHDSIPAPLRDRIGWLTATLATLRADLALAQNLRQAPVTGLPCPLDAYAGEADPLVPDTEARAWKHCTLHRFRFRPVRGTHFFVRGRDVPRAVGEALRCDGDPTTEPGTAPAETPRPDLARQDTARHDAAPHRAGPRPAHG